MPSWISSTANTAGRPSSLASIAASGGPATAPAGTAERRLTSPSPSQARLLRHIVQHPDGWLRIWSGQVVRVPNDTDRWHMGEPVNTTRATAMVCVRFGWLGRVKGPDYAGAAYREGPGFYELTELGRAAIEGLSDSAFVSRPGKGRPSHRGLAIEMRRALSERHDPARGWAFIMEAPLDIGGRPHHIDALAINYYASGHYARIGYEIKVSRGDFLSELRRPQKTARSATFCSAFYFVCPAGMLKPDEVPDPYGLIIVRPQDGRNGRTRILKRSRLPSPAAPTWGLVGRLLHRIISER